MQEESYAMGMFELKEGRLQKIEARNHGGVLKFSKEANYTFEVNLGTDSLEKKTFPIKSRKYPQIEKVGFSKNNLFFFEAGRVCTIWDYESENKVAVYEDVDSTYDLIWLNENQYVLFRKYKKSGDGFGVHDIDITWNEILMDKSIKERTRKKIASYMVDKTEEVGLRNLFIKDIDEKTICTVVGGSPQNGIFAYENYIDFWDVETERKIFSLNTGNEMLDVVFLPEKSQFLIIERRKDHKVKVSFWDLKEKIKIRELFLAGVDMSAKRKDIEIINGGEEMIVLAYSKKGWKLN